MKTVLKSWSSGVWLRSLAAFGESWALAILVRTERRGDRGEDAKHARFEGPGVYIGANSAIIESFCIPNDLLIYESPELTLNPLVCLPLLNSAPAVGLYLLFPK